MNFECFKPLVTLVHLRPFFSQLLKAILILIYFAVAECSGGVIQLHGAFNGSGWVLLDQINAPNEESTVGDIMPKFGAFGAGFIPVSLTWSASEERFGLGVAAVYPNSIDETKGRLFPFSFTMSTGIQTLWELHFFVTPSEGAWLAPADTVKVEGLLIWHGIGPHPGEGPGHPFFVPDLSVVGLGGAGGGPFIQDMNRNGVGHQNHWDEATAVLRGARAPSGDADYLNNFKSWSVRIDAAHVPEPASFAIMGALGLGGAVLRRWKQTKHSLQ